MRRAPVVAVDDFSRPADLFFLTHAHTDHMKSLNDSFAGVVHCTRVTASLVHARFPRVHVAELIFYQPLQLAGVIVTAIPANHCPGSCMLKFESDSRLWLHTGDFRLDERMLREAHLVAQPFDEIHLDTTFARSEYEIVPSKRAATAALLQLIEEQGESKQVYVECDMLGTEPVLQAIQGYFKPDAVHVQSEARRATLQLLNIEGITHDATKSRFHFVPHQYLTGVERGEDGCLDKADSGCLFIKPSMQFFRHKSVYAHSGAPQLQDGVWHVKYSLHSSMGELRKFVAALKPKSLKATTACDAALFRELQSMCTVEEKEKERAAKKSRTDDVFSLFD